MVRRLLALFAVLALGVAARAEAHFDCKLWMIRNAHVAADAPAPRFVPDATFRTEHISFFMEAPAPINDGADAYVHDTIGGFLDSADPVTDLTFSGLTNAALGAPVTASTLVTDSTPSWNGGRALFLKCSGPLVLTHDQIITITHDDGVSLYIDGVNLPGFDTGSTLAVPDRAQFTGASGWHVITLYYTQTGGGAILSFSPAM